MLAQLLTLLSPLPSPVQLSARPSSASEPCSWPGGAQASVPGGHGARTTSLGPCSGAVCVQNGPVPSVEPEKLLGISQGPQQLPAPSQALLSWALFLF